MKFVVLLAGLLAMMSASFCTAQDAKISTTVDSLLETLKRPSKFDFSSANLNDVAAEIEQQFKVNVIVQNHAFEETGLEEVRVTFRADGISLRSAILSMLDQFDATFAIRWESIVLTTNERAERYWRPAVYAVTDLVSVDPPNLKAPPNAGGLHGSGLVDFDSLISLIQASAAPETWSDGTGPSSDCIGVTVGDTHLLIVSQSESTHAEIERLLAGMRKSLSARTPQESGK